MQSDNVDQNRWAIILAGGEGKRLSSLTLRIAGDARPKQFCSVVGDSSLIEQTQGRVSLSVANDRILVVVTRKHERYYEPLLGDMRRQNLVIQPHNRGTAAAILYSLLRLSKLAPAACVALFPSDHFVSKERHFMSHVDAAFDAVRLRPELTVLLGIAADSAETAYGWIQPGQPVGAEHASIFDVRQFWEKPSAGLANRLLDRSCLWNSFVLVGQLSTLLGLIMVTAPGLYLSFASISSTLLTSSEVRSIEMLYASISDTDFSHDVLAVRPNNLAVLPVRGCEWSDLGEPRRVLDLLSRRRIQPRWNAA
jgi:mannose-1-phosphate guanylyltransferase